MLSISGTLDAIHGDSTFSPYVEVSIVTTEPSTLATYSSDDRLKFFKMEEEIWGGRLELWVSNHDNALSVLDFRGRRVRPKVGYVASGNETVEHQPFWVVNQNFVSHEGISYCVLTCWNVWEMMSVKAVGGTTTSDPPSYNDPGNPSPTFDTTISAMVDDLLDRVKLSGFTSAGIPLTVPGTNMDVTADFPTGAFKEYEPQIIAQWGDSARKVIRNIMDFTESILRMDAGTAGMEAFYPDPAGAVDYTYGTGGGAVPYASTIHTALVVPNRIIYEQINPSPSGDNDSGAGVADNADSQSRIGVIVGLFFPDNGTQVGLNTGDISEANEKQLRADAILNKLETEAQQGEFLAQPIVHLEVYDKIRVVDPRNGTDVTGRVGRVETTLDLRSPSLTPRERYIQEVSMGGLSRKLNQPVGYFRDEAAIARNIFRGGRLVEETFAADYVEPRADSGRRDVNEILAERYRGPARYGSGGVKPIYSPLPNSVPRVSPFTNAPGLTKIAVDLADLERGTGHPLSGPAQTTPIIKGTGVYGNDFDGAILDHRGVHIVGDNSLRSLFFRDSDATQKASMYYAQSTDRVTLTAANNAGIMFDAGAGIYIYNAGHVIPTVNSTFDLGESGTPRRWRNVITDQITFADATSFTSAGGIDPLEATFTSSGSISQGDLVSIVAADTVATATAGSPQPVIGRAQETKGTGVDILIKLIGPLVVVGTDGAVSAGDYVGLSASTNGRVTSLGTSRIPTSGDGSDSVQTGIVSSGHTHLISHGHGNSITTDNENSHDHSISNGADSTSSAGNGSHHHSPWTGTTGPNATFVASTSAHNHGAVTGSGANHNHGVSGGVSSHTGSTGALTGSTYTVSISTHTHTITPKEVMGIAKTAAGSAGANNLTIIMFRQ